MFNRPRCRDWTALATQQLRLRSLIRITGHNIVCAPQCQLYFTLHSTAMSAPFFTSEKVDPHGTGNVDWSEISSCKILKSAARSVCIRVWEHRSDLIFAEQNTDSEATTNCPYSDKMLFIWGVHFSGLIPITKRSDVRFHPNSLAFQMHGGYFASANALTSDTVRRQLATNYELEHAEDSAEVCSYRMKVASSIRTSHPSSDNSDLYSTSNKQNNFSKEFEINSPRGTRSRSPVRAEPDTEVSCISLDKDMLNMLKVRYIQKKFLDSEVRSSYSLESLLKLQEKQRKYKQKNEHATEISEKICMKSAFCLNLELITSKGSFYQSKGNPSMGRTLNRLLFQDIHMKPEDILKAQELRRQIESARFRCQLLSQEKDRIISGLRKLEKQLGDLHDHTIEQESWLMACYRNLGRENENLVQEKAISSEKKDLVLRIQRQLRHRRALLCKEFENIYPISKTSSGQFAICNVILPNSDNLIGDNKVISSDCVKDSVSPLSLSVALGYVAHVVYMCSIIYNIPLRNPIKHEGSRSRILEIVKELPSSSREFPLYCRTSPFPKAVCYAIYLLNQNIAQLNFQIHSIKCDLRETLLNLLRLISGITPSIPEILDMVIRNQNLSISSSSVDLHVPVSSISKSVDMINRRAGEERLSRSMGSYSDEQTSPERNVYSSEPILSGQNKIKLSEFNENCNI